MVSVEVYEERFSRLKEVDPGKDQVIEDLISEVKELERGLTEKKLHLEREQETTKLYQSKHSDVQVKLQNMEAKIGSNGFVSVLIDGDSMLFVDHLIKSTKEGGIKAARHLRSKACEYVSNELHLLSNIQIRVRVYANIKGLASTYCHNRILDSTADFNAFVRGFNMGHPMSDFIDAGDEKECADSKLKAWFDHDMDDVQCQAVIFGGSTDGGYARLLHTYVGDNSKNKQITLLEGPPFVKELIGLKDKFLIACFPDIFRNTKLPSRKVSFSTTPPPTPTSNALSYAATIATPVDDGAGRSEDAYHFSATVPARRDYPVLQNSKGQRLDAIINPPQSLVWFQRDKKLCNPFHILGECHYRNCTFQHGERLDETGIEARRLLARQTPCSSGLQCKDKKCLLGHQCPDKSCANIGGFCRFTPEMHRVDRT